MQEPESSDPREWAVRRFGRSPLSFDALQCAERYGWFASGVEPGAFVPYRRCGSVDVVLGEPLSSRERLAEVAAEFFAARREASRAVLGFCATEPFMRAAVAAGGSAVQILAEPEFDPSSFEPRGGPAKKLRVYARRLRRAGFEAVALPAGARKVPDDFRHSADALMADWLARGVARSAHVLEVDAWRRVSEKRYFAVFAPGRPGRLCSLLIAHPVYARAGYHLCHLIHAPDAPKGVSELAALTALETFGDEGVRHATFGPVALSRASGCENMALPGRALFGLGYPLVARFGHYANANEFYRKFHAGPWTPRWVVLYPRGALARSSLSLLRLTHVLRGVRAA
jgi:lysylphosphatidylglycerol synthetase-like protein (DUF2156 family)